MPASSRADAVSRDECGRLVRKDKSVAHAIVVIG